MGAVGWHDLFLNGKEKHHPGALVDTEMIELTVGVWQGAEIDDCLCPSMMGKSSCTVVSAVSSGAGGGSGTLESVIRPAPLSGGLTMRTLIHRVWVPLDCNKNTLTITWPLLIAWWHLRPVE